MVRELYCFYAYYLHISTKSIVWTQLFYIYSIDYNFTVCLSKDEKVPNFVLRLSPSNILLRYVYLDEPNNLRGNFNKYERDISLLTSKIQITLNCVNACVGLNSDSV